MTRPPPRSPLFPTPPLSRSRVGERGIGGDHRRDSQQSELFADDREDHVGVRLGQVVDLGGHRRRNRRTRSEEHTSELQSLAYLVCRLLLEKKKLTRRNLTNR